MRHRDSKGHEGVIAPGGIQWMTAARGIIHSEMPEQEDGLLSGFQLWINLPAALKMAPAEYHEFDSDRIPVDQRDGARLRVFSGSTRTGVTGPVVGRATDPFYADIHLDPGAELRETLPAGHNAFIMVYDGAVEGPGEAGPVAVTRGELAVLDRGDDVALTAGPDGASLLLVAARPLGEPVARAGPFVMNTKEEIYQAYADYRDGRM